jgi:hypothetical protein
MSDIEFVASYVPCLTPPTHPLLVHGPAALLVSQRKVGAEYLTSVYRFLTYEHDIAMAFQNLVSTCTEATVRWHVIP